MYGDPGCLHRCWQAAGADWVPLLVSPALRAPPFTSPRHPVGPCSSEDGGRTKETVNQSTAHQATRQIRSVGRSAQRHQGGARRAEDSRGAECPAGLIHRNADLQRVKKYMGPRLREDDGARDPSRGRQGERHLGFTGWSAVSRFPGTAPRRASCAGSSRRQCRRCPA